MHESSTGRVLIVEDDDHIATLLREQLEFESYETDRADSGGRALALLESTEFDLIILDLGLPDQNGFEICRSVRARGVTTPLLVLTARDETADKVRALDLGADDYLTKPFETAELLARARALLRRPGARSASPDVLRAGDLRLDLAKHKVTKAGQEISLTVREFDLLAALVSQAGDIVSRDNLLERLWPGVYVTPRTVDVHVAALRKKLSRDGEAASSIVSVRGVGYRFDDEPS